MKLDTQKNIANPTTPANAPAANLPLLMLRAPLLLEEPCLIVDDGEVPEDVLEELEGEELERGVDKGEEAGVEAPAGPPTLEAALIWAIS